MNTQLGRQTRFIARLIDIIAGVAVPDQIILFGARAAGNSRSDGDYDFLVVVPYVENERNLSRRIYYALAEHHIDVPLHILAVDRDTLDRHRDTPGMIYHQVLTESIVCFDRRAA